MGIFGKKKGQEFEGLHNDNLFTDDDDIIVPSGQKRVGTHRIGQNSAYAPHALTANEVRDSLTEEIPMEHHPQPDSVYKRMMEREQQAAPTAIEDDYVPSWATPAAKPEVTSKPVAAPKPVAEVKSPQPVAAKRPEPVHSAVTDAFLERCRQAVEMATREDERAAVPPTAPRRTEPAAVTQHTPTEAPAPEPRSVDDIIRMLRGDSSDGRTEKPVAPVKPIEEPDEAPVVEFRPVAAARPAEKPVEASAFEFRPVAPKPAEAPAEKPVEIPVDAVPSINEDSAPADPEINFPEDETPDDALKVEVEVIPTDSDSDIMQTTGGRRMTDGDVRVYGKVVRGTVLQQTPEGEVELSELIKAGKATDDTIVADDRTIMFGDLGSAISQKADDEFESDADDEYFEARPYYETADPAVSGIDDYKDLNDAARLRTRLMAEKSGQKTVMAFSCVAAVLMLITALLPASFLPKSTVAIIDLIILAAAVIINHDVFADFKNLFKMRPKFDSCVAIVSLLALVQSAVSAFVYDGRYAGFASAAAVMLAVNRIARFMKSARVLRGLELIANSQQKRAVSAVGGSDAKIISSGAVRGEALVLCDRKTVNIRDYLKNCGYDSPFDRKVKALLITSAAIALVVGVVAGYFGGLGVGLTAASALLSCLFPACAAFVCELPMYLASKKMARLGAVLAGYKGAYELNLANLVAVSSADLFPEGSIKLYKMNPLGENEVGKTLIDAAAVARAANSPLSPIFIEMLCDTSENELPKVNGVQYEDKMGVSGWIGERTILIGNRNLMQGHNVSVPAASIDQKILRAGYFPVYIAVDGVPCLLLVVKYEVDPLLAHELQVLCNTGMTVVVDPKDPNTTEAMLCDYFGLPNDALKVMNHNGRVSYERIAAPTESATASAAFGKSLRGFFSAVTSSIRLGGIYSVLTALFIIAAVLGTVLLVYLGITGKASLINSLTVSGFQLLFAVVAAIIAKIRTS